MRLNPAQRGEIFEWALTADGHVIQLFKSQSEALIEWRKASKRRGNLTQFSVEKVKGLFDG